MATCFFCSPNILASPPFVSCLFAEAGAGITGELLTTYLPGLDDAPQGYTPTRFQRTQVTAPTATSYRNPRVSSHGSGKSTTTTASVVFTGFALAFEETDGDGQCSTSLHSDYSSVYGKPVPEFTISFSAGLFFVCPKTAGRAPRQWLIFAKQSAPRPVSLGSFTAD
ncbi:hypothetical protein HO133_004090 [Letharia lupina]|uniref:Uncharacterized protein n=1 Tax=Letharia lupina TaxID=560253 RepID=A0A8H6F962_9LECA|nr:uncharacterized protein HO133_004090 [Letharia lupina]KAF6219621.1 hypothetical protein HO133_004090 [Letharia lupina]